MVGNFYTKSFHEIMESGGWLVNRCLALSPNKSGNNLSLSTSSVTPLYFTMSLFNEVCQMRVRVLTW